jgi:hypothetical protein
MIARPISLLLLSVPLAFWLTGCSTVTRSASPAPVVDHSAAPATPSPAESIPPVPQVTVQPLPRPLPLEPEAPVSMVPATPKPRPPKPKPATPPPPQQQSVATAEPAEPLPQSAAPAREVPTPPAEITHKGNAAVVALLDNARKHATNKEYDKAAADLDRAIRLEPKNAGIWRDLALMRLYQGKYKQAEDTAAKAKSLAGNDEFVRARSQEVISAAQAKAATETQADTSK